jgi:hypothetical protein
MKSFETGFLSFEMSCRIMSTRLSHVAPSILSNTSPFLTNTPAIVTTYFELCVSGKDGLEIDHSALSDKPG